MSLIEVFVALAILAISILGLVGGLIIASSSNGIAATRTQMSAFALSRLERISGQVKQSLCSTVATDIQGTQSCSYMTHGVPSPFVTDVAPNTAGWMLDVIDWPMPSTGAGDDVMYGPVVVMGDANAIDVAATISLRATMYSAWGTSGGTGVGCDSTLVTTNPKVLCREIHIEPYTQSGITNAPPMLKIWVRVLRGGTTDWHIGTVSYEAMVAQ
jgi:hypothetical protein